jgi:hypothetical protein
MPTAPRTYDRCHPLHLPHVDRPPARPLSFSIGGPRSLTTTSLLTAPKTNRPQIRNYLDPRGASFRPLCQSRGATLEFQDCLLRRRAALPATAEVANLLATQRPAGVGRAALDAGPTQQCSMVQNLSYRSTSSTTPLAAPQAVWLEDVVAEVAEDRWGRVGLVVSRLL